MLIAYIIEKKLETEEGIKIFECRTRGRRNKNLSHKESKKLKPPFELNRHNN
jgi:hypothetical protein